GKVTFDNVVFGYNEDKTVLNGITLYAKPGQKIAFVGSTGAGKTTITNLINRFYDVPDGKIRYDDININKIKKADLRRSQSIVLQDTHLFTGTIADNIRYGKLGASDEEVRSAAVLANADTFIKHLPDGYNTIITAQTIYGFLLMNFIRSAVEGGCDAALAMFTGIFAGLAIGLSAFFQGKVAAASADALGETGKGTA
ncbi:membrane protein containing ABC transporter-like domain protein, partial [human gut metagenome]